MFTADMARMVDSNAFDEQIAQLVADAYPEPRAYYKVWWEDSNDRDRPMNIRAMEAALALRQRGFEVTEIRDLGSFRYAEVHFNWEKR
ncbi:hypothetical protein [Stenotrophomonas maltophilia]|uniref:hypothetical protein n=1 Tax=Stenotrophomonas maltophilia TaxID=40324 RepID=UPI003BF8E045